MLRTRIIKNGEEGEMAIHWPLTAKIIAALIPILLSAAIIGQFRSNIQLNVIAERLTNFMIRAEREYNQHSSFVPRTEHEILQHQHDREVDELRRRITTLELARRAEE